MGHWDILDTQKLDLWIRLTCKISKHHCKAMKRCLSSYPGVNATNKTLSCDSTTYHSGIIVLTSIQWIFGWILLFSTKVEIICTKIYEKEDGRIFLIVRSNQNRFLTFDKVGDGFVLGESTLNPTHPEKSV